jgi:phosphohistidine phosphatase
MENGGRPTSQTFSLFSFTSYIKMKQLYLVRHAKSDWGEEGLKDIDRPLNARGYNAAYTLSEWFIKKYKAPELLISSDATRALSTAMIFARNLDFPTNELKVLPQVYESTAKTLTDVIHQIDERHSSAMIFCHNPGVTNLANELGDLFFDNLPTCALVAFEFDVNGWKDIGKDKCKVLFYQFPKEFK